MTFSGVMVNLWSLLQVPLGILISTLGTYFSSRAQVMDPPCSFLITLLLICSGLTALSGVGNLPNNWAILLGKDPGTIHNSFLLVIAPHDLARSVLSCANSLILVNKAIFILTNYSMDPKQFLTGTFGVLAVLKIFLVLIIPEIDSDDNGITELKSLVYTAILELMEGLAEIICLILLLIIWVFRRNQSVEPSVNAYINYLEQIEFPSIPILLINRVSLFIHLVKRFSMDGTSYIPLNSLIGVHSIFLPLIVSYNIPSIWSPIKSILNSENISESEIPEEEVPDEQVETSPSRAPTRPSSVILPQALPGSTEESKRVMYKSNIRQHRSALESVVSATRRRKWKKTGKGPLDGAMLDMVGEKIVPLEESDSEDEGNCKTM